MTSEKFKQNAHLYLGITRKEFARRLESGKIDFQILKSEIELRTLETELESLCEVALKQKSADQLDKFDFLDDSSL
jgi:hypothetical protein